jgi:hypothetical protein
MPRDCDQRLPLYTTNVSAFNFPFSYILSNQYKVQDIQKALPYTNEPKHDAGLFPRNIKTYIWSVTPKNDTWSWTLLCELTNGNYAFYTASCLSDFDEPKSTMSLSVSPRLSDLIMQVLTDAEYSLYEKKTQPLPLPLPYYEDKD